MSTSTESGDGAGSVPLADEQPALQRCISCAVAAFADRHWGREPLLSRAIDLGGDFTDLLSEAAVDELVSRRGLRTPFLRMAKDGTVLPNSAFTRSGGAGAAVADQAADDKVLAAMADGATLVLQGLHRTWPPLVDFGSRLAAEVGHPVQINAYITPPQSQGFAAHYDVHDVFVLQVAGRKRWTIHPPVIDAPLDNQPWQQHRAQVAARAAEPALIDTTLEPGDSLYLPRGTIHAGQALGETSIHLTVGIHPITRYQLVQHLLDLARQDPQLRTPLPLGVDLSDPTVLADEVADTVAALRTRLEAASVAEVARKVGATLMQQTRPAPVGPLAQLAAASALQSHTRLRLRAQLRARTEEDAEAVRLVLADRTIELPRAAADAVKLALTGTIFAVADLPGVPAEDQLVIARRLVREGVLVPADPASR